MNQLEVAVEIAKVIEKGLPDTMHVGLTGGTLYKDGARKDIDFVVYSHKCFNKICTHALTEIIHYIGFYDVQNFGRVIKCKYVLNQVEVLIDIIVPESATGEYVQ